MATTLDLMQEAIAGPATLLLVPQAPISLYYIASGLLVAIAWFLWRSRAPTEAPKKLWSQLFPKQILLHPSAIFDYQYFFFSRMVWVLCFGILFLQGFAVADAVNAWLTRLFGPRLEPFDENLVSTLAVTVVYVLVYDFCYWLFHWLLHVVPWLWVFHKGHHAAEVLTPFTAVRSHPVEEIINANFIALGTGASYGIMTYLFGNAPGSLEWLGVNALMLVYYVVFYNLRHSHIWLPITGPLGAIIQSPAHHQIHHSTSPEHIDKNFGYCLALWDWLFGTLYIPKREESFALGIGKDSARYHAMIPFLVLPFQDMARLLRKRLARRPDPSLKDS